MNFHPAPTQKIPPSNLPEISSVAPTAFNLDTGPLPIIFHQTSKLLSATFAAYRSAPRRSERKTIFYIRSKLFACHGTFGAKANSQ